MRSAQTKDTKKTQSFGGVRLHNSLCSLYLIQGVADVRVNG